MDDPFDGLDCDTLEHVVGVIVRHSANPEMHTIIQESIGHIRDYARHGRIPPDRAVALIGRLQAKERDLPMS